MARPEALLFDFGNVLVHIDFDRVCAHWARHRGLTRYHSRMSALASPVPHRPSRAGSAAIAALVLLLAWQLAHWTWVFFAPRPTELAPAVEGPADLAVAARLFGSTLSGTATEASATPSSLRLKGVVAPTPGTAASAIFSLGSGRDVAVKLEGEVQPGVKLVEVLPNAVVLQRGGIRERIELESFRTAAAAQKPAAGRPVGFRLNVARPSGNQFALSRRELDDALRDPAQLAYLGRIGVVPSVGVRLEEAPPGSLAQKLGLQAGDVIKKLNGQPVASTGDLARVYTQFSMLTQVQAEVQRGGVSLQLSYAINP